MSSSSAFHRVLAVCGLILVLLLVPVPAVADGQSDGQAQEQPGDTSLLEELLDWLNGLVDPGGEGSSEDEGENGPQIDPIG